MILFGVDWGFSPGLCWNAGLLEDEALCVPDTYSGLAAFYFRPDPDWSISKARTMYQKKRARIDLKRALIDRDMLDYRKYRRFIREREERLIKGVRKELDLSEDDYDYYALWPDVDDE